MKKPTKDVISMANSHFTVDEQNTPRQDLTKL